MVTQGLTIEQATGLATRIMNCWHGGPTVSEWRDYLLGLDDHQRAVTVFERFRGRLEHPPTIKAFADEYRALAHLTPRQPGEYQVPKLSRERVQAILIANGAPERMVKRSPEQSETKGSTIGPPLRAVRIVKP